MTKFIILSGKKQHGKNYFSEVLKDLLLQNDFSVVDTSFAEPIKRFCQDVFGFSSEDMNTEEGKKKQTHLSWSDIHHDIAKINNKCAYYYGCVAHKTPHPSDNNWIYKPLHTKMTIRELLQVIGTDVFRNGFYSDIWAEAPFRKQWKEDFVIITDCRFPNEVRHGVANNAIFIRVHNTTLDNIDNHQSETALDNYCWNKDEVYIHSKNGKEHIINFIKQNVFPKLGI